MEHNAAFEVTSSSANLTPFSKQNSVDEDEVECAGAEDTFEYRR
jgi:hypothetical protein